MGAQAFVTAGVNVPIFNRNQGNIASANAEITRAESEVVRLQMSLRQSAEQLVQSFLSDQAQADRYRHEMLPRAERAYRLYLTKYRQMAAAYPQVLISQRTFFQLQVAYIHVLENLWRNVTALQNYGLTSGLSAPVPSGRSGTILNVPNSSSGSMQ